MSVLLHPAALEPSQARALLKAMADPLRLQVIDALGGGERCVCELTSELGLAQSKLSFHLKVMREAGLIEAREEGRWVYYSLRAEAIERLRVWLGTLSAQCRKPASSCQ
jgi:ArsR family transcriptional regulator, arsenate/arsenite/antimonite-responsive transcriptional repressor